MTDMKAWYLSKTVWGALVAILASLLQMLGVELAAEEQNAIADAILTVVGAAGGLIALYGRVSAKRTIGRR